MIRHQSSLLAIAFSIAFLFTFDLSFCQKKGEPNDVPLAIDIFGAEDIDKAGIYNLGLPVLYSYSTGANRFDGETTSKQNGLGFNLRGGFNVIDGLSIRGQAIIGRSKSEPESSDFASIDTDMIGRVEVLKSLDVGSQKVFVGASAGASCYNFKEENSGSEDFEQIENSFGWSLLAEAPILLRGSNLAFVPALSYFNDISKIDGSDNEFACSGGRLGARLDSYFNCGQFDPLHRNVGQEYSGGRYGKGTIALYGSNHFNVDIGSTKDTFESGSETFEQKGSKTDVDLNVAGGYYFADGLAGILDVDYSHFGVKDDESDDKSSNSDVTVQLGIQYHLPIDNFQNVYAKLKAGIGSQGSSYTDFQGEEQSSSDANSQLSIAIGAYHHFLPSVALNPIFQFSCLNWNDSELSQLGCFFGLGLTTFL